MTVMHLAMSQSQTLWFSVAFSQLHSKWLGLSPVLADVLEKFLTSTLLYTLSQKCHFVLEPPSTVAH